MNDRENAISFVLNMVTELCLGANVSLIAKEKNGINYVAVLDNTTNKEYVMTKQK